MTDEFDFLRLAEAENETLRNLLNGALAQLPGDTEEVLRDAIREALSRKPVKTMWRLGVEEAVRHLKTCQQAEEEATQHYIEKEFIAEAKVSYEYSRAFDIAVIELEKWLNT